ncbi:MAG: biotin/lipoate A/B protein ligase family protein [Syntrophales bacterium]|jgi:lipoyl(octanoyl) transferase
MIWRFISFKRLNAFENMAIDEAIFRENQRTDSPPTLRFYSWSPPSVSLGYFQITQKEINTEACRRYSVDIVRRPTGGKAVLHENDLTYAVIASEHNPLFPPDILGTYKVISSCIAEGLSELGIEAEMEGSGRSYQDDSLKAACFSSPSRYELLAKKKKICGSAQLRSKGIFLQHGSILIDFDPVKACAILLPEEGERSWQIEKLRESVTSIYEQIGAPVSMENICHVMKKSFEKRFDIELVEGCLTAHEESLKLQLMNDKYMNDRWNRGGKAASGGRKNSD